MKKMKSFITVLLGTLGLFILASCDTLVGQGAAWGAATGAIIGGAATGNVRAASIGAAAGAVGPVFESPRACASFCPLRCGFTREIC